MDTDVLIIGGGLAGLSLAMHLEERGKSYQLIEARSRFGGRIKSQTITCGDEFTNFDLGPTWFWPGQPRIAALINRFGLSAFYQYATGALTYEDDYGHVQQGKGFASMEGSYRLIGGLSALTDCLVGHLQSNRLHLNKRATMMTRNDGLIETTLEAADGSLSTVTSKKTALAIPPRVVAENIQFNTRLPKNAVEALRRIPTWMAGHAKLLAIYKDPFWRHAGLSGDAMSRKGPMVEIHDASPAQGGPYALFGFFGVNAKMRKDKNKELAEQGQAQLVRLFGKQASTPIEIVVQDWAFEPETATPLDLTPVNGHPVYGRPDSLMNLWDGQLVMASTETAAHFGGYLEGALEASEVAATELLA